MDLFREKHTPQTECGPSEKTGTALNYGMVSFYGLGNFIDYWVGGLFQLFWEEGRIFRNRATAYSFCYCCSVAQSCLNLCDPTHGLQHAGLPCPSPSPGACSDSCPLSRWWHPTISSSVTPFPCLQSFPASGSFLMSQLFPSGGQSTEASASAPVLLMNIQDRFSLGLTGLISLQSKALSRVFSNTTVQKHQFFGPQPSLWFTSHIHTWLLEKP